MPLNVDIGREEFDLGGDAAKRLVSTISRAVRASRGECIRALPTGRSSGTCGSVIIIKRVKLSILEEKVDGLASNDCHSRRTKPQQFACLLSRLES